MSGLLIPDVPGAQITIVIGWSVSATVKFKNSSKSTQLRGIRVG